MPVVLEFVESDLKLLTEQFSGMVGAVAEHIVHAEELRFMVYDDACVRRNRHFAVCKGVERVDGTYFVNGEVASISVTELLHKHGLAPNYEGIDNSVLEEARKRGKAIHLDIEAWVRGQEMGFVPETREGLAFAKWAQDKMLEAVPEQAFALDYNGMTVACTVDLRGFFKINGKIYAVIDDHKATSRFYREYVSWQTSIYDYIARSLNGRIVNGEKIKWTGADALICTLFDKDGGLTVKNCDKIPDSEIERLLECELKGEKYTRRELVLPDEMGLELNAAEETLVFYEKAYKAA